MKSSANLSAINSLTINECEINFSNVQECIAFLLNLSSTDPSHIINISAIAPLEYALPLYGFIMPLLVTITTITNSFIIVVLSQKHLRTPTNFVLLSMALTDLLTGLTSVPWFLHYYTLKGYLIDEQEGMSEFWCRTHPILSHILPTVWHTAGIYLTVFLAVQRYIYVCVPSSVHRVCTPKTTKISVLCIVAFAFLTEIPEFLGRYNLRVIFLDKSVCFKYYSSWVRDVIGVHLFNSYLYWFRVLLVHCFPCISLLIFTYKLANTIKKSETRKRSCISNSGDFTNSTGNDAGQRRYSIGASSGRSLYATNRMLSTICGVFLTIEIPAALIFMIHSLITIGIVESPRGSPSFFNALYHFLNVLLIVRNLLIVLTSPIQFAIYCSMSEQFRLTVRQFFSSKLLFVAQAQATFHGGKRYSLILVDVETSEAKRHSLAANRRSLIAANRDINESETKIRKTTKTSHSFELTKLCPSSTSNNNLVSSTSGNINRTIPKVAICVMSFGVYFEYNDFVWDLGSFLCKLYIGADVACSTASILNLLAISLDRYIAISHPLAYAQYGTNGGRALISISLVWGVSFAVGMPVFMGANQLDDATEACEFTNGYFIIVSSLLSFFLPCLAMIALYTVIFKRLKQRERARSLRHYQPSTSKPENERISTALLSGARIARQMGQHFKDKTDQILLEISFQTSSFPTLSSSEDGDSISSDNKSIDQSIHLPIPRPSIQNLSKLPDNLSLSENESEKNTTTNTNIQTQNTSIMRSFGEDLEDELFPFIDSACSRTNSKTEIANSQRLSSKLKKIKQQNFSMAPLSSLVFTKFDENFIARNSPTTSIAATPPPSTLTTPGQTGNEVKKESLRPRNGVLVNSHSVPLGVKLNGYLSGNGMLKDNKEEQSYHENHQTRIPRPQKLGNLSKHRRSGSTDATKKSVPMLASVYSFCRRTKSHPKKHFIPLPGDKVLGVDDKTSLATNSPKMRSDESWHDSMRECKDELWRRVTGGFRTRPSRQLVKKATKQMKREHKATVTLAVVLAVFLGCWLPFFTLHLTKAICMLNQTDGCVHILATFFTTWLGYLNSSLNPLIYTVFDQRFRKAFRNILKCSK